MPVEIVPPSEFVTLENPGVVSQQLVCPMNSPGAKMTLTRLTMQPGAVGPRHSHPRAEQVTFVERGTATLLLANDQTAQVTAGQAYRTPAGEIHGLINTGSVPFVYITATTPPEDMTQFYETRTS